MKTKTLHTTVKVTLSLLLMTFLTIYVATSHAGTNTPTTLQPVGTATVQPSIVHDNGKLLHLAKGHPIGPADNRCRCDCCGCDCGNRCHA